MIYHVTVQDGLLVVVVFATRIADTPNGVTGGGISSVTYNGAAMANDNPLGAMYYDLVSSSPYIAKQAYLGIYSLPVSAGSGDIEIIPMDFNGPVVTTPGIHWQTIESQALNLIGLADNVLDCIASGSPTDTDAPAGAADAPYLSSPHEVDGIGNPLPGYVKTTVPNTQVVAAFGLVHTEAPSSWTWGQNFTSTGQDVRNNLLGYWTDLAIGKKKLTTTQRIYSSLTLSGFTWRTPSDNWAGVAVAYR